MPKFQMSRMKDLLWPEVLGIGVLIAGHIAFRTLDAKMGWSKPFRRSSDYFHVAALGGGAFAYGKDMAPGLTRGIVLGDVALLGSSLGDVAYEKLSTGIRPKARVTPRSTAEILAGNAPKALPPGRSAANQFSNTNIRESSVLDI